MGRLESSIERSLRKYAKKREVLFVKIQGMGNRGMPDRLLLYRGRAMFCELKQLGKKPNKLQEARIRDLREFGFEVQVVDSVEFGRFVIDRFITYTDEMLNDRPRALTAGCSP